MGVSEGAVRSGVCGLTLGWGPELDAIVASDSGSGLGIGLWVFREGRVCDLSWAVWGG